MANKAEPTPAAKPKGRPALIPQAHGGALAAGGTPGNKGGTGAGRPPKSFATFMRSLRESPDVQKAIREAASHPESRGFGAVLKTLTEYDTEKPAKKLELTEALSTAERARRIERILAGKP